MLNIKYDNKKGGDIHNIKSLDEIMRRIKIGILSSKNTNIRKIKRLFYNPETDSLKELLKIEKVLHSKILKKTDFSKAMLMLGATNYYNLIKNSKIPKKMENEDTLIDLIDDISGGLVRWHSPRTMYNLTPSPLLYTIAALSIFSLYNPNIVWDIPGGKTALAEQRVVKEIAEYIGWDWKTAGGVFTFGGKATTIYGIKVGLKKCFKESSKIGVKKEVIVISTKACHPSHIQDAEWLGIGAKNVVRLNTHQDSTLDLKELEEVMLSAIKNDKKIAAIVIAGGTTNNMSVDPINKVVELRDKLTKEHLLDYVPHIHVDAVVGFPWIFFKDYDFKENSLRLSKNVIKKIFTIISNLKYLKLGDSFGMDFHKLGFCPYPSSIFMIKAKDQLYVDRDNLVEFGCYTPFTYTIENSRPGTGAVSAYIALNLLGIEGFQIILAELMESANYLQKKLVKTKEFEIISKHALGNSTIFVPKLPKKITFSNSKIEEIVRNNYTTAFLVYMRNFGNPFLLDMTPAYSTGSEVYPYKALKACIMTPLTTKEIIAEFIDFMIKTKKTIDLTFDFENKENSEGKTEYIHPLKERPHL